MRRFAKNRIFVKVTQITASAAAALALLLGGSSPANAQGPNGEDHRVIITNLYYGFPSLVDCGFFGGSGCHESQVYGALFANTIVFPYQPHYADYDMIMVGHSYAPFDVKEGVWYRTYEKSLSGMVGGLQVYANLTDQIRVFGDFADRDTGSSDDEICNKGSWSKNSWSANLDVSVLAATQGWKHIVMQSAQDADGRCAISFDVIALSA